MRNPYELLGVSANASQDEIEKAYRKRAMEWHPDRHEDGKKEEASKKFKEITAAYEILSDTGKRENFDRFGTAENVFGGGKPFTSPIDDFMRQFFGGVGGRPQKVRGNNIVVETGVTLEDVFNGCNRDIRFKRHNLCDKCHGIGGEEQICHVCNGSGFRIIHGAAMTVKTSCANCDGSGKVIGNSCSDCDGGYKQAEEITINFNIPKGVETGMRFAYQGMGEPIYNGIPGDLCVVIKVLPHDAFKRDKNNILITVPVTYSQLVLGDEISVPTLTGTANVKISTGTQSGSKIRLNGMGLPKFNDRGSVYKFGDEIIQLELEVPANPEGRYRELIVELSELEKQKKNSNV